MNDLYLDCGQYTDVKYIPEWAKRIVLNAYGVKPFSEDNLTAHYDFVCTNRYTGVAALTSYFDECGGKYKIPWHDVVKWYINNYYTSEIDKPIQIICSDTGLHTLGHMIRRHVISPFEYDTAIKYINECHTLNQKVYITFEPNIVPYIVNKRN